MKKLLISFVAMFGMSMAASAYRTSAVFLQHKGHVTTFEPESINNALEASVDGDTIFLNEGTFPGFEISKRITVRGSGLHTNIDGDVTISITDKDSLTATLLESVNIYNSLIAKTNVKGVKILKCQTRFFYAEDIVLDDAILDRCCITESFSYLEDYINHMTAINSNIRRFRFGSHYGDLYGGNMTFLNCNIAELQWAGQFTGTFINCILDYTSSNTTLDRCTIINTLINSSSLAISSNCVTSEVYEESNSLINNDVSNDVLECIYDTETLASKGYLGNDGTVIGIYGGKTPYTLEPAYPKVTKSQIELDTDKKQLNVTLTVSPQ